MRFQSFDDVLNHLDKLGLFHMDFKLDRMHQALTALGLLKVPYITVQIVGTNGKGSTATFLTSLARAHGLNVGTYTSPHFVTPRERIRINGQMLVESFWPSLAERIYDAAPDLTYFEFLTALGLLSFAESGVDLVVLEAGLGGRYDATTAMPVNAVAFTPIGMDHEKVLGPTLRDIAADKAEAIRDKIPAFTAPQEPEVLLYLRNRAEATGSTLCETSFLPEPSCLLGLAGPHQYRNARLACAVWEYLAAEYGWGCDPMCIEKGLASARFAGRLQSIPATEKDPDLLLDGAHNPHGLQALESALVAAKKTPRAVLFSCLADKDISDMLPIIRRIAGDAPIFVPTIQDNERAMNGSELAQAIGKTAIPVQRLNLALTEAAQLDPPSSPEHPILLCGSLYLLGEFFTLRPQALECMEP